MIFRNRQSRIGKLLAEQAESAVSPGSLDLWPAIAQRLGARRRGDQAGDSRRSGSHPYAHVDQLSGRRAIDIDAMQSSDDSGELPHIDLFDGSASPRRREIATLAAGLVAFAIVASALALIFGSPIGRSSRGSQQSIPDISTETPTETASAPAASSFSIPVTPAPGLQVEMTARGWTADNGDIMVQIEARGPESQLELMWYAAAGSCAIAQDEQLRHFYSLDVHLRANSESSGPGYRSVTLVLQRDWFARPLVIGAFHLGGDGASLACGDVPAIASSPLEPSTTATEAATATPRPVPTASPTPTPGLGLADRAPDTPALVLVSQIYSGQRPESGLVTVVDLATGEEFLTVRTGFAPDAALSPDSSTLYVAGGGTLAAFDLGTGAERWSTHVEGRELYMGSATGGAYPTVLAVAPDGSRLFVYSSSPGGGEFTTDYFLRVIDTETGEVMADTEAVAGCGSANMSFSPDGSLLYLMCPTIAEVVALDLTTLALAGSADLPSIPEIRTETGMRVGPGPMGKMAGSVASRDGETIYLVTHRQYDNTISVAVIGSNETLTAEDVDLGAGGEEGTADHGIIALVEDDTKLVIGVRTGSPYAGQIDQVRVFDTTTWEEVTRISVPDDLHSTYVAVDPDDGAIYAARIDIAEGTLGISASEVVRIGLDGTVEPVLVREREEVIMIFTLPAR